MTVCPVKKKGWASANADPRSSIAIQVRPEQLAPFLLNALSTLPKKSSGAPRAALSLRNMDGFALGSMSSECGGHGLSARLSTVKEMR